MRLSTHRDDPGYLAYCIACGDNKKISIFLDGEPVHGAETADDIEGIVVRTVFSPEGHIANDGEKILMETVRGAVRIEIE